MEILRCDDPHFEAFGQVYLTTAYPARGQGLALPQEADRQLHLRPRDDEGRALRRPRGVADEGEPDGGLHRRPEPRARHGPARGLPRVQGGRGRDRVLRLGPDLAVRLPRTRTSSGSRRTAPRSRTTGASCRASSTGELVRLLVTGGSGFIGANFVRDQLARHPDRSIVNLDCLTYAGNPANLADLASDPRYLFVRGDIRDAALVGETDGGGRRGRPLRGREPRGPVDRGPRRVRLDERAGHLHPPRGRPAGRRGPVRPRLDRRGLRLDRRRARSARPTRSGRPRRTRPRRPARTCSRSRTTRPTACRSS